MFNRFRTAAIIAALWLAIANLAAAQTQQSPQPPTPTTRILAIGTFVPNADMQRAKSILPSEVRATVQLYLDGKIDQWYSLNDRIGVAFIVNGTDPAAAHEMLEKLPLGQAHLMRFELIPLAPLNPLRQLQGMAQ